MAAKTVDAMINVEPYNAIAEAEGLGTIIMDLSKYDKVPVFMAATPDFVEKNPDAVVAYLKAWLDAKKDFKDNPKKVSDVIYSFFTSKGYKMDTEDLRDRDGPRRGRSGLPVRPGAVPDAPRRGAGARRRRFPRCRTGRWRCAPTSWTRRAKG